MKTTKEKINTTTIKEGNIVVTYIRRFSLTFSILALAVFAAGCGMDQSPVASQDEAATLSGAPMGLLVFSTGEPERAAKKVKGLKRTGSEKIGSKGGTIVVADPGKRGGKDDLQATFTVPKKALKKSVEITVNLYGDNLEELVVEFGPSGLEFKNPSQLVIQVGKDKLGSLDKKEIEDQLQVYHIHGDESEEMSFKVKVGRDGVELIVKVPGFSRYSMGR